MKTLNSFFVIIIIALLGMGFYLNDKVEKLQVKLAYIDKLNINEELYVMGHLNVQEYLSVFGTIGNMGSYINDEILIEKNQIIVGYQSPENTTITKSGIYLKNSIHNKLIKLSPFGISLYKYSQGDKEYYLNNNIPWEEIYYHQ